MKEKMISRGDLFYYDFGDRVGSVQSGERPVLVVQADDYNKNAPTVIVAAVTSVIKKRYLPSHIILGDKFGLKKPSMVLLEQVQTVNKDELSDYIGTIEDEHLLRQINATLKKTFGLWVYKPEKEENVRCLCTLTVMPSSDFILLLISCAISNPSPLRELLPVTSSQHSSIPYGSCLSVYSAYISCAILENRRYKSILGETNVMSGQTCFACQSEI